MVIARILGRFQRDESSKNNVIGRSMHWESCLMLACVVKASERKDVERVARVLSDDGNVLSDVDREGGAPLASLG